MKDLRLTEKERQTIEGKRSDVEANIRLNDLFNIGRIIANGSMPMSSGSDSEGNQVLRFIMTTMCLKAESVDDWKKISELCELAGEITPIYFVALKKLGY